MIWEWHIPDVYQESVAELAKHNHPLYETMRKLQKTESGQLPHIFEIYPNVFLWRQYGYRIIYERMREQRLLLLATIQKM
jgi:hypothetical protein